MYEYEYEYVDGDDFKIKFEKVNVEPSPEKIGSCLTPERGSENRDDSGSPLFYTCSVCGGKAERRYNFCPNCGKPMNDDV